MPKPRAQQISLSDTPYYHVCSRVVRKVFLCGMDESSGKRYEHRRDWVAQRIWLLSQDFAIDIYAYAMKHLIFCRSFLRQKVRFANVLFKAMLKVAVQV